jgi:hypothetical protein
MTRREVAIDCRNPRAEERRDLIDCGREIRCASRQPPFVRKVLPARRVFRAKMIEALRHFFPQNLLDYRL